MDAYETTDTAEKADESSLQEGSNGTEELAPEGSSGLRSKLKIALYYCALAVCSAAIVLFIYLFAESEKFSNKNEINYSDLDEKENASRDFSDSENSQNESVFSSNETSKTSVSKTTEKSSETTSKTSVDPEISKVTEAPTEKVYAETAVTETADPENESVSATSFPIDINLVTCEQLLEINGVGDVTAGKIIDYRNSVGVITSLEQLGEIDGIGEKTIEKLKDYLYVSSDAYVPYTTTTQTSVSSATSANTAASAKNTTTKKTTTARSETTAQTTAERSYSYVNINTADAQEISDALLITLEQAEDIVALREVISYFSSVEELSYVESLTNSEIAGFMDFVLTE